MFQKKKFASIQKRIKLFILPSLLFLVCFFVYSILFKTYETRQRQLTDFEQNAEVERKNSINASSAKVYYSGTYWNDYDKVQEYLNNAISNNIYTDWVGQLYLWKSSKNIIFKKALILSCGNGWVERMLIKRGIIESAVGIDVNDDLLLQAKLSAKGLPIRYYHFDSNLEDKFPESGYDIVINHAALHHVAYIDFHIRAIYNVLQREGGILVNYDYVGPHRNQYSMDTWKALNYVNELSAPEFRHKELKYPHLPTMLVMDPSEAVHSELIKPTLNRYFDPLVSISLGGAIAYPLLTHNHNLQESYNADKTAANKHIEFLLGEDVNYTKKNMDSELFWYSIMQVKRNLKEEDQSQWTGIEVKRENLAKNKSGVYYTFTTAYRESYQENL
jgi:SAM-dependent methyltransferase